MSNYAKFKVGDRVRFVEGGCNEREHIGAEATVIALDADGYAIVDSDAPGETIGWTKAIELVTPAAPAITLLDDAGRAALKAGDRVLIEAELVSPDVDSQGDLRIRLHYAGEVRTLAWANPSSFYALLPPAPKPIAVGDTVRQARPKLRGVTLEVLASVDGHLLLRDQRDGHVSTGEAKDFEVVS